jgi:hypothetical protein
VWLSLKITEYFIKAKITLVGLINLARIKELNLYHMFLKLSCQQKDLTFGQKSGNN